jgi:hypothetical protein
MLSAGKSKAILAGLYILSLPLAGCKKDITGITFDLSYQTSITIPSSTGINVPVSIPTPDIATNSSTEFKNQGIDASRVRECVLKRLGLRVSDPPGRNFNFLRSIQIYIVSPSLPAKKVAFLNNIPSDVSFIELTPTNQDISEYIKGETFKIRAELVLREVVLSDITVDADLDVEVRASIL